MACTDSSSSSLRFSSEILLKGEFVQCFTRDSDTESMRRGFVTCLLQLGIFLDHQCQAGAVISLAHKNLRVGSWNIQVLGQTKIAKNDVVDVIVKTLKRYDLAIIQELRDADGTAMSKVVDELNTVAGGKMYHVVKSERLGSTVSKEQYVFVYSNTAVEVVDTFQYRSKIAYEEFERPPFAVKFKIKNAEISELAVINIHTSPEKALKEISNLAKVYDKVQKLFACPVLIAGDFNADCSYASWRELDQLGIRKNKDFHWLIGDQADTTVSDSDCSYDRFVSKSDALLQVIVPQSIATFKFDREYDIKKAFAEQISDHYPIEFLLKGKINREIQREYVSGLSFTIKDQAPKTQKDLRSITLKNGNVLSQLQNLGFVVEKFSTNRVHHVIIRKENVDDVVTTIHTVHSVIPKIVTSVTVALVDAHLKSAIWKKEPYIPGVSAVGNNNFGENFDVLVFCYLISPQTCRVTVSTSLA